jgi:hypothetical protein
MLGQRRGLVPEDVGRNLPGRWCVMGSRSGGFMRLITAVVASGCLAASPAAAVQQPPPVAPVEASATAGERGAVSASDAPAGGVAVEAPAGPAASGVPAAASGSALPVQAPADPSLSDAVPKADLQPRSDITIDRRTGFSASVGYGGPLGASATVTLLRGLGADVREGSERVKAVCAAPTRYCANGFLLETAAGVHGGRLSLGLGARARVEDEEFHGTVGVGLKLSLVRDWNSAAGNDTDRTWLGPEFDVVVKRFGVGCGVLWPVSGPFSAAPRFSWTIGFVL